MDKRIYFVLAVFLLIVIAVGVSAFTPGVAPNPGHTLDNVAPPTPCVANSYLEFDGVNWVCSTPSSSGGAGWVDNGNNIALETAGDVVGIGIASSGYKLDVNGQLNLRRGVSDSVLLVDGLEALWFNGNYFRWGFGGNDNYFADSVGIGPGTTSPTARLHVAGRTYVDSNGAGGTPSIDFALGDHDSGLDSTGDGDLDLVSNFNRVVKLRDSYVGINLAGEPTEALDVSGNTKVDGSVMANEICNLAGANCKDLDDSWSGSVSHMETYEGYRTKSVILSSNSYEDTGNEACMNAGYGTCIRAYKYTDGSVVSCLDEYGSPDYAYYAECEIETVPVTLTSNSYQDTGNEACMANGHGMCLRAYRYTDGAVVSCLDEYGSPDYAHYAECDSKSIGVVLTSNSYQDTGNEACMNAGYGTCIRAYKYTDGSVVSCLDEYGSPDYAYYAECGLHFDHKLTYHGRMGVGSEKLPKQMLDVEGLVGLQVTDTPPGICDEENVGAIYFDSGMGEVCVCHAFDWVTIDGSNNC